MIFKQKNEWLIVVSEWRHPRYKACEVKLVGSKRTGYKPRLEVRYIAGYALFKAVFLTNVIYLYMGDQG
jgi:hypothetical protein